MVEKRVTNEGVDIRVKCYFNSEESTDSSIPRDPSRCRGLITVFRGLQAGYAE